MLLPVYIFHGTSIIFFTNKSDVDGLKPKKQTLALEENNALWKILWFNAYGIKEELRQQATQNFFITYY